MAQNKRDFSNIRFPIVNLDGVNYIGLPMDKIVTEDDEQLALDYIQEMKVRLGDDFNRPSGRDLYTINHNRRRRI